MVDMSTYNGLIEMIHSVVGWMDLPDGAMAPRTANRIDKFLAEHDISGKGTKTEVFCKHIAMTAYDIGYDDAKRNSGRTFEQHQKDIETIAELSTKLEQERAISDALREALRSNASKAGE